MFRTLPILTVLIICGIACESLLAQGQAGKAQNRKRPVAPPMSIGLAGVSSYSSNWQFVDMMKHSREWRAKKDWQDWDIIEGKNGWPISLKNKKDGSSAEIDQDHQVFMWLYNRYIAGDIVLTWEGDADVQPPYHPMKASPDTSRKKQIPSSYQNLSNLGIRM